MTDASLLSLEQAAELCKEWVPIGARVHEYASRLEQARFKAFLPAFHFAGSFCANVEERETHRQYVTEHGKEAFGAPNPYIHVSPEQRKLIYRSEFNNALRADNDRRNGGLSHVELNEKFPKEVWRMAIDPGERARMRTWILDMATHDARWAQATTESQRALDAEVEVYRSGLSAQHSFGVRDRLHFYLEVMKRDAAKLGFSYDSRKSKASFPVFSSPINPAWDLCLTLGMTGRGIDRNPREGAVWPSLELRQPGLKGASDPPTIGRILRIPYNRVIPGYYAAYRVFRTLDELEVIVRAHLCLLEFSLEEIVQTARKYLPTT